MAKTSITDYFAISTDRISEQDEETEEQSVSKLNFVIFCYVCTLPCVSDNSQNFKVA